MFRRAAARWRVRRSTLSIELTSKAPTMEAEERPTFTLTVTLRLSTTQVKTQSHSSLALIRTFILAVLEAMSTTHNSLFVTRMESMYKCLQLSSRGIINIPSSGWLMTSTKVDFTALVTILKPITSCKSHLIPCQ